MAPLAEKYYQPYHCNTSFLVDNIAVDEENLCAFQKKMYINLTDYNRFSLSCQ